MKDCWKATRCLKRFQAKNTSLPQAISGRFRSKVFTNFYVTKWSLESEVKREAAKKWPWSKIPITAMKKNRLIILTILFQIIANLFSLKTCHWEGFLSRPIVHSTAAMHLQQILSLLSNLFQGLFLFIPLFLEQLASRLRGFEPVTMRLGSRCTAHPSQRRPGETVKRFSSLGN